MPDWLQAVISLPAQAAEAASAALFESGARSVWEDLPDRDGRAVLKSGFAPEDAMRLMTELPLAAERIGEAFGFDPGKVDIELELKAMEDWDAAWRKDQRPVRVSDLLVVAPSFWRGDPDAPTEGGGPLPHVVRVDPGAAFGSGRHPTTFLCLRLISEHPWAEGPEAPPSPDVAPPGGGAAGPAKGRSGGGAGARRKGGAGGGPEDPGGAGGAGGAAAAAGGAGGAAAPPGRGAGPDGPPSRILDLGAGSGILSLAAAMLFPEAAVTGLDSDADTVDVARRNAEANGVSSRAAFLPGSLEASGALDAAREGYDLLMANITLNPLLELAAGLTRAARPGARLVLSGLLADQAEECARAYQRQGWHWIRHLGQEEWSALELALPGGEGDRADGAEGGPDPERDIVTEPSLETRAPAFRILEPSSSPGGGA